VAQSIDPVRTVEGCRIGALPMQELLDRGEPVVLRGLAGDWPVVEAGRRSTEEAMSYLRRLDSGRAVQYSYGAPEIDGRPFYNQDFSALNFEVRRGALGRVLDDLSAHSSDPAPPTYYIASLLVEGALPGFAQANDLRLAEQDIHAPPSIWIGNRVVASCHFDAPNNIAVCAVGRRQFTLFPPEQIENLYPGPMEPTPGGQVVSLVDFAEPDLRRHPRFVQALASARTAMLEPGDAIFIPSMWWHHVRSLDAFNVLVNYWWRSSPSFLSSPLLALQHALWTVRDLPDREKEAWAKVFDYYVFGPRERAGEHLPAATRDILGPVDENMARRLRAMLIGRLNR
jgi:hypothetical protein